MLRPSAPAQRILIANVLAIAFFGTTRTSGESWSRFQNGGEVSVNNADLPLQWSPSKGIAWQTKLAGYGQSSPVSANGSIYVTSTSGGMKEHLHVEAFDRQSGKQLWQFDLRNSSPEKSTNYISRAAPSPVCDTNGVIAFFEGGNVVSLGHDGKLRWKRDLATDYGPIAARHGLGSSLEHDGTSVFAWIERQDSPYVVALSKENGETVWKSDGLGVTSWSSPRLVPVGDKRHLVLSGIGKIAGLDPQTGERLWSFDDISGNSAPTPIPLGEGRFLIGATEGRGQSGGGNAAASNGVIQIDEGANGKHVAKYVWRAKKATSSFGSPISYQGHAYFVNRSGVVHCLDLRTGEERYAERSAGSIWATPLAAADRLYLFGKDGKTTVIKSGPKFEELAANALWRNDDSPASAARNFGGPVLYAVIAVDEQLIFRRGDILYAVQR